MSSSTVCFSLSLTQRSRLDTVRFSECLMFARSDDTFQRTVHQTLESGSTHRNSEAAISRISRGSGSIEADSLVGAKPRWPVSGGETPRILSLVRGWIGLTMSIPDADTIRGTERSGGVCQSVSDLSWRGIVLKTPTEPSVSVGQSITQKTMLCNEDRIRRQRPLLCVVGDTNR